MLMVYEEYMCQFVVLMCCELIGVGFDELIIVEEVENFMEKVEGIIFVVVNFVCGCVVGFVCFVVMQVVFQYDKIFDNMVIVFVG